MNTLQRLFDRLIGIARLEAELRRQAHHIFDTSYLRPENLELPACWRRPARIQGRRLG